MNLELIMCLIGNLMGIYIISRFFPIFFERENSRWKKGQRIFLYIFYFLLNSAVSFYLCWPPVLIFSTNILGCLMVSWSYKGRWRYRICAVLLIVTMSVVCEDVVYYYLNNLRVEYAELICIQISNLLLFMLVLLLQKGVDLRNGEEIAFSEWLAVIIIPVCSLLISIVALRDCKDEITVVIGGTSMILMNVFVFFLLDRIQKMYRNQLSLVLLEQQNQAYENQLKLLQDSEEKMSMLKHDLKNHFLMLSQLAEKYQCTEVSQYIYKLISLVENQRRIVSTGNLAIDGFLNLKLNEAIMYGADIETDLNISTNVSISSENISIILGNLLDNALRAIKGCQKNKFLTVVMRQNPGILFIEIKNSYNNQIRRVGDVFQTTKERKEGHGFGLKNVQRVVEEYHGKMEVSYTKEVFSVKLIMFL